MMIMHLIYNPCAGVKSPEGMKQDAEKGLRARGIAFHIHQTDAPKHAQTIVRDLSLQVDDQIGILGGDGTIHEVINGLFERKQPYAHPLLIFPTGSGNDLARALGITQVAHSFQVFDADQTKQIDLGLAKSAEGHFYFHLCTMSAYLYNAYERSERWRLFGRFRYVLAGYFEGFFGRGPIALKITGPDINVAGKFRLLTVGNPPTIGNNKLFFPGAKVDDGELDCTWIEDLPLWRFIIAMWFVQFGQIAKHKHIHRKRFKQLRIESETARVNLDAQQTLTCPVDIEVLPNVLSVYG